jgi:hypothetical protein
MAPYHFQRIMTEHMLQVERIAVCSKEVQGKSVAKPVDTAFLIDSSTLL